MEQKYRHFTLEDRIEIANLQAHGRSIRQIAAALDRAPSSISRELRRNRAAQVYKPVFADQQGRARRWTGSKLERDEGLRTFVLQALSAGLSPEQVVGRMILEKYPARLSHETIYRFIYAQMARYTDYAWRNYLPQAKSKRGRFKPPTLGTVQHIKDRVSIAKRPRHINTRKQPGHWEVDLMLFSGKKSNILVTQERASRFVHIVKQADRTANSIATNLDLWFKTMPKPMRRTLTQDNGVEFAHHYKLNATFSLKTFFCDPHSPWQKGGIENINGRLRRHLPLNTDFQNLSPQVLQIIEDQINNTPRKCLGYKTPAEIFSKHLLHFKCESTSPRSRG